MTSRSAVWILLPLSLALAAPALAQSAAPTAAAQASQPAAAATPTTLGDTGLWFVPTADILSARKWSFSLGRTNTDDGQGFSDVSTFPLTFGVGIANRAEVFASLAVLTRIDRDSRPLFFASSPATTASGTGGGLLLGYPLDRKTFLASGRGDAWLGAKVNLTSQADGRPLAFAVRAMVKAPTGSTTDGASTGKADFSVDAIASRYTRALELTGFAGAIVRGNPAGYQLTNGLRWGLGAAFPARWPVRITTELFGERYNHNTLTAPAGQIGADGSPVPISTTIKNPVNFDLSLTLQLPQGFFVGGGLLWNVHMAGRSEAGCLPGLTCPLFTDTPKDRMGIQVRLGFDPGARSSTSRRQADDESRRAEGAGAAGGQAGGGATGRTGGATGSQGAGAGGAATAGAGGTATGGAGASGGTGPGTAGAAGAAAGVGAGATGAGRAAGAGATGAGSAATGSAGATGPGTAGAAGAATGVGAGATGAGTTAASGALGSGAAGGGQAAGATGTGARSGGALANRAPAVRAGCDPCSVEAGKTLTVSADAQDPDGDPLSYRWTAPSGTFARPSDRQTLWTAPLQIGPVTLSVLVDDGRGGTTRDSITVQVVGPDTRALAFEDVHFDFDRSVLRADALPTLDGVVAAMRADPAIRLDIEGNTCNIGTPEYNLALGERRARAVRDYLVAHGVSADRLTTVSYGEERPKYDNSELDGRRLNRRAAMVVRLR